MRNNANITLNAKFTLTDLQNTLIVVDQICQFIGKLERHGLQTRRLGPVHNYTLSGLIQGSLNRKAQNKTNVENKLQLFKPTISSSFMTIFEIIAWTVGCSSSNILDNVAMESES